MIDFQNLAKNIAVELTLLGDLADAPVWSASENGNSYHPGAILTANDGRSIYLRADDCPDRMKRVEVSGNWPTGKENFHSVSYHQNPPAITAALSRGAQAIARDIRNRFLPDFNKMWEKAIEAVRVNDEYLDNRDKAMGILAEAWPSSYLPTSGESRVYIGNSLTDHSGSLEVHGSNVDVIIHHATLEQALEIAKIMEPKQ